MNLPLLAVVLLLLAQSDTSALVEASKASKAKRKGSTTKVITNDDVKKADKSKVTARKGSSEPVEPQPTLMEKHEAGRKTRLDKEAKLKVLNETIAGLENELARLEQTYFETNDLTYRDTELVKRFEETRERLEAARKERDALGE